MKQKVVSFSDAEFEFLKKQAEELELPMNELIRRMVAQEMKKFIACDSGIKNECIVSNHADLIEPEELAARKIGLTNNCDASQML